MEPEALPAGPAAALAALPSRYSRKVGPRKASLLDEAREAGDDLEVMHTSTGTTHGTEASRVGGSLDHPSNTSSPRPSVVDQMGYSKAGSISSILLDGSQLGSPAGSMQWWGSCSSSAPSMAGGSPDSRAGSVVDEPGQAGGGLGGSSRPSSSSRRAVARGVTPVSRLGSLVSSSGTSASGAGACDSSDSGASWSSSAQNSPDLLRMCHARPPSAALEPLPLVGGATAAQFQLQLPTPQQQQAGFRPPLPSPQPGAARAAADALSSDDEDMSPLTSSSRGASRPHAGGTLRPASARRPRSPDGAAAPVSAPAPAPSTAIAAPAAAPTAPRASPQPLTKRVQEKVVVPKLAGSPLVPKSQPNEAEHAKEGASETARRVAHEAQEDRQIRRLRKAVQTSGLKALAAAAASDGRGGAYPPCSSNVQELQLAGPSEAELAKKRAEEAARLMAQTAEAEARRARAARGGGGRGGRGGAGGQSGGAGAAGARPVSPRRAWLGSAQVSAAPPAPAPEPDAGPTPAAASWVPDTPANAGPWVPDAEAVKRQAAEFAKQLADRNEQEEAARRSGAGSEEAARQGAAAAAAAAAARAAATSKKPAPVTPPPEPRQELSYELFQEHQRQEKARKEAAAAAALAEETALAAATVAAKAAKDDAARAAAEGQREPKRGLGLGHKAWLLTLLKPEHRTSKAARPTSSGAARARSREGFKL